jgi:hypothetical protein
VQLGLAVAGLHPLNECKNFADAGYFNVCRYFVLHD